MSRRSVAAGLLLAVVVVAVAVSVVSGAASQLYWNAYAVFSARPTLRVAVPPLNDEGQRLLTALQQEIASVRTHVRLAVVETASLFASAQALREHHAELRVRLRVVHQAAGARKILRARHRIRVFALHERAIAPLIDGRKPCALRAARGIHQWGNRVAGMRPENARASPPICRR